MTFPMVLKQLREELQIQQKELAELLRLNSTTVNHWEAARVHPSKRWYQQGKTRFEFYYHVSENGGRQCCCRAKYTYYDKEQGICVITRTDLTEAMHQEKKGGAK